MANKITLLSALPHSIAEVERAKGNPRRDYVFNQLLRYYPPKEIWRTIGPHLEGAAGRLFAWCEQNGIEAIQKASRATLTSAAERSNTIIVLAHWKGAGVRRTDILSSMAELKSCIDACRSVGILSAREAPHANGRVEIEPLARLAQCLTIAVRRWYKWLRIPVVPGENICISNFYGQSLARGELNALFGEHILPGACLELDDGLWAPTDIAQCFPAEWSGICDFACCTSTYLSESVKTRHHKALFRADARFLEPKTLIPALQKVLLKVQSGCNYMRAIYEVDREYGARR
jgi:hypothetical protein